MRLVIAGLMLVMLVTAGCSGQDADSAEPLLDVQTFPEQEVGVFLSESAVRQILDGEIEPPSYNSNPPTSGAYSSKAAACGIFRQPVPDVYQVHNLAIGAVLVQYSPTLEAVDVERLEDLGRSLGDGLIMAPRAGMGAPVVATAWTTMMELDTIDEVRLSAFYERYVGEGPEAGECAFTVDEGA
jgi:hypothetical protein